MVVCLFKKLERIICQVLPINYGDKMRESKMEANISLISVNSYCSNHLKVEYLQGVCKYFVLILICHV